VFTDNPPALRLIASRVVLFFTACNTYPPCYSYPLSPYPVYSTLRSTYLPFVPCLSPRIIILLLLYSEPLKVTISQLACLGFSTMRFLTTLQRGKEDIGRETGKNKYTATPSRSLIGWMPQSTCDTHTPSSYHPQPLHTSTNTYTTRSSPILLVSVSVSSPCSLLFACCVCDPVLCPLCLPVRSGLKFCCFAFDMCVSRCM